MSAAVAGAASEALVREVVTPEGVPIKVTLAGAGDRLAAFLIDALIVLVALVVIIAAAASAALSSGAPGFVAAIAVIACFLVVNGWFIAWEMARGATPGKLALGTRVVDARGGPLTAEAVFVRNLTRDVEIILPLVALLSPESIWPGAEGWTRALATLWPLLLGLLPLANRDRRRVGDLIAGTVVVRAPAPILLEDLGEEAERKAAAPAVSGLGPLAFTPAQLDHYGEAELHVLEELLRSESPEPETLRAVAQKIRKKIGFSDPPGAPPVQTLRFLKDFYAAQRAHLEKRMLFGERRADKHAARRKGKGG